MTADFYTPRRAFVLLAIPDFRHFLFVRRCRQYGVRFIQHFSVDTVMERRHVIVEFHQLRIGAACHSPPNSSIAFEQSGFPV